MSDYLAIDNECPDIILYQQYRRNDPSSNFFAWIKRYWQSKYYDYIMDEIVPQLSSCNAYSDYLQFFALYWYGILRPVDVTGVHRYDDPEILWDDSSYDYRADAGVIDIEEFKKIIAFLIDWTENDWNIPLLFRMIRSFTGLGGDEIAIEQDDERLDVFVVTLPSNGQTTLFQSLVLNYKAMWNFPLGINLEINLT